MCLDKSTGKCTEILEKVSIIFFLKVGLPRTAICRVRQCTETRKIQKKKRQKRTMGSTDARKEDEPARQDHPGQEGSQFNENG